jgi:uncharacterized protein YndB with AHSA1/START domain
METDKNPTITVETTVNSSKEKVWECWIEPKHITQWNNASDDWHTPFAENDLRVGGRFLSRMEAKDGRKVKINFISQGRETRVIEAFEAETTNSIELQKTGWQSILDNFKKYVEQQ